MLAKFAIALVGYIAISPHVDTLKYRIILIGIAVGGLSGFVGTMTRLQPVEMIPVNVGYGLLVATIVTTVLHALTSIRAGRHPFRAEPSLHGQGPKSP